MFTRLTDYKSIRAAAEFETKLRAVHGDKIILLPDQEYLGSGCADNKLHTKQEQKLQVKCGVCDHQWGVSSHHLIRGTGCPACSNQRNRDNWGKRRCPPGTDAEKQQARDLRAEGLSYSAISKQLGRALTTIMAWCDPSQLEKTRLRVAAYHAKNREACYASSRRHRGQTPHGKAKDRAHGAKRRGYKNDWYTNCPNDISREQAVYLECERITRETGVLHHVDHIWPLDKGGPHLWFNLQVITAEENLSKGNTYRPEDVELYRQRITDLFNQAS